MLKKKILVVENISSINFIFLFFLKIFYRKIFFYKLSYKNKILEYLIEVKYFIQLSYEEFGFFQDEEIKLIDDFVYTQKAKLKKNRLYILFNNLNDNNLSEELDNLVEVCIINEIRTSARIILFSNRIKRSYDSDVTIFDSLIKNYFSNLILKDNRQILFFGFANSYIIYFIKIFKLYFNIIINSKKNFSYSNLRNKIAFFPNQGIYYRNVYLKDHYFSQDPKSPFYFKKILVLENKTSYRTFDESTTYYDNNEIKYLYFNKIPFFNSKILYLKLIKFFFSFFSFSQLSLSLFFIVARSYIDANKNKLMNFKKLKIILIGYDTQFPIFLSYACKELNILLIANQERLDHIWWVERRMILDYYFTIDPCVKDILQSKNIRTIKNYVPIGPIRLFDDRLKKDTFYITTKKKYSHICGILDWENVNNKYLEKISWNSLRNNIVFYELVYKIVKSYPSIFFVMKGINHIYLNLKEYEIVVNNLLSLNNLMIIKDYNKWNGEFFSVNIDFCFGRHTSLIDELLIRKKMCIIVDEIGFLKKSNIYSKKVISSNFEELYYLISQIINNKFTISDFYGECKFRENNYEIKKTMQLHLQSIFNKIYYEI